MFKGNGYKLPYNFECRDTVTHDFQDCCQNKEETIINISFYEDELFRGIWSWSETVDSRAVWLWIGWIPWVGFFPPRAFFATRSSVGFGILLHLPKSVTWDFCGEFPVTEFNLYVEMTQNRFKILNDFMKWKIKIEQTIGLTSQNLDYLGF